MLKKIMANQATSVFGVLKTLNVVKPTFVTTYILVKFVKNLYYSQPIEQHTELVIATHLVTLHSED